MDEANNISIKDLRTIIHGLKMTGFAFVDKDALQQIELRIKDLPPPEELERINDANEMKRIIKEVGEIMRLVEIYGKRGHEYKVRHKSKTGLPPRYKVLEWSKNMNKASIIKELVKVSETADKLGNVKVANKLIVCAKRVRDNTIVTKDIEEIEREMKLSGMDKELILMKEAGFMDVMKGIGNVGKDVGKAVSDKAKQVGQAVKGSFNVGVYTSKLNGINAKLQDITKELNTIVAEATKARDASAEPHKTKLSNIVTQLNALYTSNEETSKKATEVVSIVSEGSAAPAGAPAPAGATAPAGAPAPAGSPAAQAPSTAPVARPFSVSGLTPEQQKEMLTHLGKFSIRVLKTAAPLSPPVAPTTMPMKGSNLSPEITAYLKGLSPEEKQKLKGEIQAIQAKAPTQPKAQAPSSGTVSSGDAKADEYLKGLKKEPGNPDVYVDNTNTRVKIIPASSKYKIQRIA